MLTNNTPGLGDPPFELMAAADSFKDLAGRWINGYAGGDPERQAALVNRIIEENRNMGYIAQAYDQNAFSFRPESEQRGYVDEQIVAMQEFSRYLLENKEDILRQRKENGIEGKY